MIEVTREQLHERIWAEPAMKLAKEFGVSGPGLAKACRKHGIPVPERGYWARVATGKRVAKRPLLPRGLGMPSVVGLGRDRYGSYAPRPELEPDHPPPSAPTFEEPMDAVRARVVKLVGRVRYLASLEDAVPAVRQYLLADEERRRKAAESKYYWDSPNFESPTEQRRLRVLNSLAIHALRLGCPVSVSGSEARDLSIRVGEQHIGFKREPNSGAARRAGRGRPPKDATMLKLEISRRHYPGGALREWLDAHGDPIERHLSEVLVELLVTGEQFHRDQIEHRYQWILERRERELEARRERAEAQERDRIARLEAAKRARRNSLLHDAAAWRRAQTIRDYVVAAEAAHEARGRQGAAHSSPKNFVLWAAWARKVADELDPIATGAAFSE